MCSAAPVTRRLVRATALIPAPGGALTGASAERAPRLVLTDRISRTNRLAGAWWPSCLDLDVELPPLLRRLMPVLGQVRGVMVSRTEWPLTPVTWLPHIVPRLRISWYGQQDANTIVVVGRSSDRLGLLVIPPATDAATASLAMRLASAPGNTRTGPDVLAKAMSAGRLPECG